MNIIGQVKMDGYLSRDPDDQLAAFIGGECRGLVDLRYVATLDSYVAFLTVYHNETSASDMELRVWNASEGQVHTGLTPELNFTAQALHGSITSPIVFEVPNFVREQLNLAHGWQWVSFNLASPALGNLNTLFKDYTNKTGDVIKGAAYYEQYDNEKGWVGNIGHSGGLNIAKGYKVNVSRAGTLPYEGAVPDPETTPIKLIKGWNWIGYTPQRPLPIAEALSGFNARVGDQVKSQYGFAVYGGSALGWIGSLRSMEPGYAYMVYSDTVATFTYPAYKPVYGSAQGSALQGAEAIVSQQEMKKELNNISYPNNMTVVLKVTPLAVSASDYIEVHARGERRGTAKMREMKEGQWVAFVTVLGERNGDKLSFVIHQPDQQKVYSLASSEDIYFTSDAQIGTLASPLVLRPVEEAQGPDQAFFPYPNPLTDVIYFWVKDSELRIQEMELRSLGGDIFGRIAAEDILRVGLHSYKAHIGRYLSNDNGLVLLRLHTNKGIYTSSIIRSKQ